MSFKKGKLNMPGYLCVKLLFIFGIFLLFLSDFFLNYNTNDHSKFCMSTWKNQFWFLWPFFTNNFISDFPMLRTPTTHFSAKWTKKTNNYAQQCHKSWSFLLHHQKRVTLTNLIFPRAHTILTSFNQLLSILLWEKNHIDVKEYA